MISKNDIKKAWKKNKIAFIFCIFAILVFILWVGYFIYEFSMRDAENIDKMNSFGEIFSYFALRFLVFGVLILIGFYFVLKMKKNGDNQKLAEKPFIIDAHLRQDKENDKPFYEQDVVHTRITEDYEYFRFVKTFPVISDMQKTLFYKYSYADKSYRKNYGGNISHDIKNPKYEVMDKSTIKKEHVDELLKLLKEIKNDEENGEIVITAKGVGKKYVTTSELRNVLGNLATLIL